MDYRYTECGLDNVIIGGVSFIIDDAGDEVVNIPNVTGLHNAIAMGIITRETAISGKELRFLRTEMGMTQAELAVMLHREPLAVSRWEREEVPIDSNVETLIRLFVGETLGLTLDASVKELSGWSIPHAKEEPIEIDGSDPKNYRPKPKIAA